MNLKNLNNKLAALGARLSVRRAQREDSYEKRQIAAVRAALASLDPIAADNAAIVRSERQQPRIAA